MPNGLASWFRFSSIWPMMPSLMCTILFVSFATPLSCVTTTMVMPSSWFSCLSNCITSTEVFESKAPVGSSARMICGRVMSALAIATG